VVGGVGAVVVLHIAWRLASVHDMMMQSSTRPVEREPNHSPWRRENSNLHFRKRGEAPQLTLQLMPR
jgi:hypothetical protein